MDEVCQFGRDSLVLLQVGTFYLGGLLRLLRHHERGAALPTDLFGFDLAGDQTAFRLKVLEGSLGPYEARLGTGAIVVILYLLLNGVQLGEEFVRRHCVFEGRLLAVIQVLGRSG